MKYRIARTLVMSFVFCGLLAVSANAQDEYKEAYNLALEAQKAKDYTAAFTHYEKAATLAEKAGDMDIAKKSHVLCAKLAKINGTKQYKANDLEGALATFDAGLKHEPEYIANTYMKGLTLKKMGRTDEGLALLAEAAKGGDRKTASAAQKSVKGHFHSGASALVAKESISSSEADQALAMLDDMVTKYEMTPDANTNYYRGLALKGKNDLSGCVSAADDALAIHRGGRSDKAKIFFLKGECMMLSGDNNGAKEVFKDAAFGSYKASALHFIETL